MSDEHGYPADSGSAEYLSQNATPVPPSPQPQPRPDAATQAVLAMRSDMRAMRWMTLATLVVVVLLALVTAFSATTLTTRMSDLGGQVSALSAQVAAAGVQQPQPQPQPTVEASPAPSASPAPTPSVGPAVPLTDVSPVPDGTDNAGAIVVGDPNATDVIEVFVDYQCPFCQRWEQTPGAALYEKALTPGSGLQVRQHTLAFLGETSQDLNPPGASARAGNAALCVVDADGQDTFVRFSQSLYATADPAEPPGQFPTEQLKELATAAGASDAALTCIDDERFVPFVAATTQAAFARGVGGTPTVLVNGHLLANAYSDPLLDTILATG